MSKIQRDNEGNYLLLITGIISLCVSLYLFIKILFIDESFGTFQIGIAAIFLGLGINCTYNYFKK